MTSGSLLAALLRGALAGAAGTTALNVVSGLDAAVRARPSSDLPEQLVATLADRADVSIPGNRAERGRRLAALGPLAGAATGVALGAFAGGLHAAGLRLPAAVGGPVLGVAAMAATDTPLAVTGLSDPRDWTAADWSADVLPHLAYGIVIHQTLVALDRSVDLPETVVPPSPIGPRPEPVPDPAGVPRPSVLRAAALGAATGARSSAGVAAVALTSRRSDDGWVAARAGAPVGTGLIGLLTAAELVADKHPATPSRLGPQGLVPRLVLGAAAAGGVARRDGTPPVLPAVVAGVSALGSAYLGFRLRAVAEDRWGSDLPGAVIEDGVAALLAWYGTSRH